MGRGGVEKCNAFSLGTNSRYVVDEPQPRCTASLQGALEVVDGKAHVMYSRAALRDEFANRRIIGDRCEKFDERVTSHEAGDSRSIGIIERRLGQSENVAIEGKDVLEGPHGHPQVGDGGASASRNGHGRSSVR